MHENQRPSFFYLCNSSYIKNEEKSIFIPVFPESDNQNRHVIHNISSALIGNEMESCLLPASMEEAEAWIRREAREGDLILTVGAGDIFKVAYSLIKN